ncbi:hypothetical protein U91I_01007 [alpha proteobacterium U9-1i]|nr:hypothetical protein U91I_01007 [alpha proteobacterium U9-1i]
MRGTRANPKPRQRAGKRFCPCGRRRPGGNGDGVGETRATRDERRCLRDARPLALQLKRIENRARNEGPMTASAISPTVGGRYSFITQYLWLNLPNEIVERLRTKPTFNDDNDTLLYCGFEHELAHFAQNLSTSYGLFKTLTLRSAGTSYWMGIQACLRDGVHLTFPIDDMLKRGAPLPDEHTFFGMGRSFIDPIHWFEEQGAMEFELAHVSKPKTTTTPFVGHNGTPYPVTTATLLEFQASHAQLHTVRRLPNIPDDVRLESFLKILDQACMRLPLQLLAKAVGVAVDPSNILLLARVTNDLVDLALNPIWPHDPLYSTARWGHDPQTAPAQDKRRAPWEDVHPGWRFLSACHAIRDSALSLPADPKGSQPLAVSVAERLGWPTPPDAFAKFIEQCKSKMPHQWLMFDIISAEPDLLRLRRESFNNPMDWSFAYLEPATTQAMFRGPLPNHRFWSDFLMAEVAIQLMHNGSKVWCPLCYSEIHEPECAVANELEKVGIPP